MEEMEIREIGGVAYRLRLLPTMAALKIMTGLESTGITPEVIFDVVTKGAAIGSVTMDQKRFDKQFAGKLRELMELFGEVMKYNNLVPDLDEQGNQDGSVE